jgi:hypothetical protein
MAVLLSLWAIVWLFGAYSIWHAGLQGHIDHLVLFVIMSLFVGGAVAYIVYAFSYREELTLDATCVILRRWIVIPIRRKVIRLAGISSIDLAPRKSETRKAWDIFGAGVRLSSPEGEILFADGCREQVLIQWTVLLREEVSRRTQCILGPAPVLESMVRDRAENRPSEQAPTVSNRSKRAQLPLGSTESESERPPPLHWRILFLVSIGTIAIGISFHVLLGLNNPLTRWLLKLYLFQPGKELRLGGLGPWVIFDLLLPTCVGGIALGLWLPRVLPNRWVIYILFGIVISALEALYPSIVNYPQWWIHPGTGMIVPFIMDAAIASVLCFLVVGAVQYDVEH